MIYTKKRVICTFVDSHLLPLGESDQPFGTAYANFASHHGISILMSGISLHIAGFAFCLSVFSAISQESAFDYLIFVVGHWIFDSMICFSADYRRIFILICRFLSNIVRICRALADFNFASREFLSKERFFVRPLPNFLFESRLLNQLRRFATSYHRSLSSVELPQNTDDLPSKCSYHVF